MTEHHFYTPAMDITSSTPAPTEYTHDEIFAQALSLVKKEKALWETSTCFITPRVMINMRRLIEVLRKNYYGVFDTPKDEVTGYDKIWYPLTEIMVESTLDSIDLDTKDIDFRARNPKGAQFTDLVRAAVRKELENMQFGERLDESTRQLAIDGTIVWKTQETTKGRVRISAPDLMNVYLDPTSPSIQEAYRFTERHLMYPEEITKQKGWLNVENITAPEGLTRINPTYQSSLSGTSNVKMRDVYELYGKIPKYLITGVKADTEEVDGRIVVSGLEGGTDARCHLVELNREMDESGCVIKPYEECWYAKVPGRWYGRGIAERVIMLQIYANLVFNYRINRGRISQMGIFKMKKGAGLTPQSLQRLVSNGVVQVNNMDDLQQFVIQDVSQSSYNDEEVINSLAQKLTGAFSIATGEGLPSSTPATSAAIQNQNSQKTFTRVREGVGMFLGRWVNRQFLPKFGKTLKRGEMVQIMSDLDNYKEIVDRLATYLALQSLDKTSKEGYIPTEAELLTEVDNAREKLRRGDTFVKLVRNVISKSVEAKVTITNESTDINKRVTDIMTMIQIAPEYRDAMIKQTFDLMGLPQPAKTVAPAPQVAPSVAPLALPSLS